MRKLIVAILSIVCIFCFASFSACGDNKEPNSDQQSTTDTTKDDTSKDNSEKDTTKDDQKEEEPKLLDITGITFENKTFTYDGTEKKIEITGTLPQGVSVSYTNNTATDAGTYNATASMTGEGYNPLTLSATLTIDKADYTHTGLTFEGETIQYDGTEHSVYITGNVPTGFSVVYTYDGAVKSGVTDIGAHAVVATISHKNYKDTVYNTTLTIKATEKMLYSINNNGTVYFQNDLDDDALYKVSSTGLVKASSDTATNMIATGGTIYYVNEGLVNSSIRSITDSATSSTKVYSAKAKSLTTDGTYLYYSIANTLLNTSINGIYKLEIGKTGAEATKISTDKADYLVYYNNYLYYSNLGDGSKLYKLSTSATGSAGTEVTAADSEKVSYLIMDNGVIYYNSSKTLGAAVSKYDISTGKKIKLTTDAGKYLVKVGNYIYYVNNDLLTEKIYGEGIYRVNANQTADSSASGEKVISTENNGYYSLMSDGTYLYYYKLNNKHFYKYDVNSKAETDLMSGFVPPAKPLSGYANAYTYNNEIYYINPTDQSLYKYVPSTKSKTKIVADNVAGVWYNDGYLYYSTYFLTNYALWRTNLSTNETTKISSDRFDHLIFDNDTIYAIKVGSVYNNHIYSMDLDGSNPTELFDDDNLWVADYVKDGDYIYYSRNPKVYAERFCRYSITNNKTEILNTNIKAKAFTFGNSKLFIAGADSKLYMLDTDGKNETPIAENVDVNDLIVVGTKLYYSSTNSSNNGFYVYDMTTEKITKISNTNAHGFTVCDGTLYFLQVAITYQNDYPKTSEGNSANDGALYRLDGTKIVKVA